MAGYGARSVVVSLLRGLCMGTLRVYPVAVAGGELLFEVWFGSFHCAIFLFRIAYKVALSHVENIQLG